MGDDSAEHEDVDGQAAFFGFLAQQMRGEITSRVGEAVMEHIMSGPTFTGPVRLLVGAGFSPEDQARGFPQFFRVKVEVTWELREDDDGSKPLPESPGSFVGWLQTMLRDKVFPGVPARLAACVRDGPPPHSGEVEQVAHFDASRTGFPRSVKVRVEVDVAPYFRRPTATV